MKEEKAIAISLVTASEKETGQTERYDENYIECGVVDQNQCFIGVSRILLELWTKEGDSPVDVNLYAMSFGILTRTHWELRPNFED